MPDAMRLPFGRPCIEPDDLDAVNDVLRSGWIGMGPKVQEFEEAFRAYVGCRHAVAVSSGTAALHVALLTAGLRPGQEVVVPALTFVATANAVLHAGGVPVFADIDPATLNLSPADVERRLTSSTAGILPVHYAGLPCANDELNEIARRRGLFVIEDAAHAVGAEYRGRRIGGGTAACFSFYPNKNITTIEGGMLTTDDADVAERARRLRIHGLSADAWRRFHDPLKFISLQTELGFKFNMNDVAAALGITQLRKIERFLRTREAIAELYDRRLAGRPDVAPPPRAGRGSRHAWHLYVVRLTGGHDRDEVLRRLRARGIGAAVHYRPVCCEPFHADHASHHPEDRPHVHAVAPQLLTLPIASGMTPEEAGIVVDELERELDRRPIGVKA